MRICSYNILDGGIGRADPLAEVIAAQRPDVVTLVEADDLAVVRRIAGRLGMDYVHAPGPQHAAALLTGHTITKAVNHALVTLGSPRTFLEAHVDAGSTLYHLGVVHLSPYATQGAEDQRLREIKVVLDVFSDARRAGVPHVLVGDFNANHPQQRIDVAAAHPRTRRNHDENGGRIPRQVVETILAAGYTDLHHAAAGDAALKPEAGATFTTAHPQQRVDYAFGLGVKAVAGYVVNDRLATYASDHYPIVVDVEAG